MGCIIPNPGKEWKKGFLGGAAAPPNLPLYSSVQSDAEKRFSWRGTPPPNLPAVF
jgi:hypothetical protein